MQLYSGSSRQFVDDTRYNLITGRLEKSFLAQLGYRPGRGEVAAWQNSLRAMADVIDIGGLSDHGVLVEYHLPLSSKRVDCIITGHGSSGPGAVIIELKQWSTADHSFGEREVTTFVGGSVRDVLHPSHQAGAYRDYLADTHTAFHEGGLWVAACAYLHNYTFTKDDVLLSVKFEQALSESPLFGTGDVQRLADNLNERLGEGGGLGVLRQLESGSYRPSKKLMEHVAEVIRGKSEYVLLDEQAVAFDMVFAAARAGMKVPGKRAIIIKGGPGTGKSVISLNLMASLLEAGYNAQYATGSKAFTETLRASIGPRGAPQFKYFNSYSGAPPDAVDVLLCDEAHRIRISSSDRFTRATDRTNLPQVQELLQVARVPVFLLDDDQVVRPGEIGSAAHIREHAEALDIAVDEYELEAQFRCAGSDGFVNWVNNTLGIRRTANTMWDPAESEFEVRLFEDPLSLEQAIRAKAATGLSARMTAGFCWPWSKRALPDGSLVEDIVIGDYRRAWNAQPNATRLAPGIPKAPLWAHSPGGIDQVGCVYTAQGFEFDYVGVIFGLDLAYDLDAQEWTSDVRHSSDSVVRRAGDRFTDLIKNTYRVLLTRGMKGCYIHFMDRDTERFVRTRMVGGGR